MQKFTAVIITFNEAKNIASCLKSLREVADEIVVLDSFSDDNTVEICEKMGIIPIKREWKGYSNAKNYANSLSKNDWIISIDADEVLSPELINSIKNLKPQNGEVFAFDRITGYKEKWIKHCGWYPDWKIRIFNKKFVKWTGDYVHETLSIPNDHKIIKLKGKLFHYSFHSTEDHLNRIEQYARLAAEEMFKNGKKSTFFKRFFSPRFRFIRTYFLKLGFLDGKEGFEIAKTDYRLVKLKYAFLDEMNLSA